MAVRDPLHALLHAGPLTNRATDDLTTLARTLGHAFVSEALLMQALTHASVAGTSKQNGKPATSYERLEFLGDRVLGFFVAEMLLHRFPDCSEGDLARRLTDLVRQETLAMVAERLDLGSYVRLPVTEEPDARSNPALLADLCEAVIAAIYLDGGVAPARAFVERHWLPLLTAQTTVPKDPKTALQEWAQACGQALPRYRVTATAGPSHRPIFTVAVDVAGGRSSEGAGSSKRNAEAAAAEAMLTRLGEEEAL